MYASYCHSIFLSVCTGRATPIAGQREGLQYPLTVHFFLRDKFEGNGGKWTDLHGVSIGGASDKSMWMF